ncbi:MAG: hypothetical protein FWF56_01265 [Firmicutes bacterium]|nr:hypothetical protein [Bacillota bacterium]
MKDLSISILIDLYGNLLPKTHLERLQEYYNNDLTINEIAVNCNLTRQAVYDSILKATQQLKVYENTLKLFSKLEILKQKLDSSTYNIIVETFFQD